MVFAQHSEELITGGVRAGKSVATAFKGLVDIMAKDMLGRPALYWIIGPDYPQTQAEMNYLYEWNNQLGKVVQYNHPADGSRYLQLRGGIEIETKSAVYQERLGSKAPDGIFVVEAGQCPEEVRYRALERASEKSAFIIYSGTLENEYEKPQYTWYTELATQWTTDKTPSHGTYKLPSWANRTIYGSCTRALVEDPALREFCPDDNHGTAHSGQYHPMMRKLEETVPPYTFAIRYAAEPLGLPFQVYPQLEDRGRYLKAFDDTQVQIGAYGGIDFGSVHPSALAAITLHPRHTVHIPGEPDNVAWVREVCFNDTDPGDVGWIRRTRQYLADKYRIDTQDFRVDPNEKFMARSYNAQAVSGSAGSRDYRIGLVTARLNADALLWDINGPGVKDAYEEARKVHRKKSRSGKMELDRTDDDRMASIENCVEGADGMEYRGTPASRKMKYRRDGRKRELRRV